MRPDCNVFALNSGVSAFPADAYTNLHNTYTNLHFVSGLASEYDYVLTLRIEIPCGCLCEPSFAAGSFNFVGNMQYNEAEDC